MKKNKIYWTMRNGKKIDVDEMTIEHLRNTLKMIIRNKIEMVDPDDAFFDKSHSYKHKTSIDICDATEIDIY
jgi:16S rRNA U1498 N3-methylase RsmE